MASDKLISWVILDKIVLGVYQEFILAGLLINFVALFEFLTEQDSNLDCLDSRNHFAAPRLCSASVYGSFWESIGLNFKTIHLHYADRKV